MKKLLDFNLGFVKYLIRELPKKKSPKELIKFLKVTLSIYLKGLLKFYKDLFLVFDADYQKQKKSYEKSQQIKVDLQRCLKMLQYIDEKMKQSKLPGYRRRQFWRDFYRDGQLRKEVFDDLLKEIDGLK
jgi:methionine salvage enolase-phosphatase E1